MVRPIAAAAALMLSITPWTAQAAEKTAVLQVANATCELCGPIIKKALSRVSGVKEVQLKESGADGDAVATVTFDDTITNVAALVSATTNAGYPSKPAN